VVFGSIALFIFLLTVLPFIALIVGSFMTRTGYFEINPMFTTVHWQRLFANDQFTNAFRTTLILGTAAGIGSPFLFSLYAYILVRTKWPARWALDSMIWMSGAIPGILAGLGLLWLFLSTPGLNILYGTIWALIMVVVLGGSTTGTNIMKGTFVQVGQDMEDASRIAGAGWFRTYFKIWIPLLLPTMIMLGVMNFVFAAGATSQIILLADRSTMTLSILALELNSSASTQREQASIVGIVMIAMTMFVAIVARWIGSRYGVKVR
jgi:iron(III) transport system permease protein